MRSSAASKPDLATASSAPADDAGTLEQRIGREVRNLRASWA